MEQIERYIGILRYCSLFHGLTDTEILTICRCLDCRRIVYTKSQVLWLGGDKVDNCGVVLSGRICAETMSTNGQRTIVAAHLPGNVFGDILMSTPGTASPWDIVAAEDSEVLLIPFDRLMGSCANSCEFHTRLRQNLLAGIGEKYWHLRRRLSYLTPRKLRTRAARWLLDEASRQGSDIFTVDETREDLADTLGANRSALSRELCRMRQEGLLDFYRGSFKILDHAALLCASEE